MDNEKVACYLTLGVVQVTMQVKGPEPGYVATPIVLVQAAIEFLAARGEIVQTVGQGGVLTPGAALLMHGDNYVQRLKAAGMTIGEITEA